MSLKNYKQAQEFLAGTQRAAQDAEQIVRAEAEKLANCGQIYPIKTIENGHQVTRYIGDSAATFQQFTLPGRKFTIDNPRRGGGK
ncbi:hypothetical protein SAMN02746095_03039 [Acidocella aminolytica 101 = DSM 11237]|uniref:Uncharacterized protein n=2 Tax=Acidocella TaxID=50709 RepID=A0A0D6PCD7_9PROT|nr:hypothetical protein Aam_015_031 [Acidocella aminolytica 101 = DSM 11237]SHF37836.1 hypothetical protein SAMN02746095_03039 [Acidocella aminolytica 101 = DSM 11237]